MSLHILGRAGNCRCWLVAPAYTSRQSWKAGRSPEVAPIGGCRTAYGQAQTSGIEALHLKLAIGSNGGRRGKVDPRPTTTWSAIWKCITKATALSPPSIAERTVALRYSKIWPDSARAHSAILGRLTIQIVDSWSRRVWLMKSGAYRMPISTLNCRELSDFGYRQVIQHLRGQCSLPEAIEETKKLTAPFGASPYAWFPLPTCRHVMARSRCRMR